MATYEERSLRRQRIRYESDNDDLPIVFQLVVDGAKVTPTSATIAIVNPSGTAVLAATAMTKTGSLLTYSVDTTTVATWPASTGYRADIVIIYDSKTYDRHVMIDVVEYVLNLGIGRDQLLARDAAILGAEHAGDEDLSPFIEACRDELQLKLEARAFSDKQVMESMIIDSSRVAIPARLYILWQFWLSKRDYEAAAVYESQYREAWGDMQNAIRYDKDLDGLEDTSGQKLVRQRLVT